MTTESEHWAYSRDREMFHGDYPTWWEAVHIATSEKDGPDAGVWVGLCVPPWPPEHISIADIVLEHIACQDDYSGDWAADWPDASKAQETELDDMLRAVLAAWLDKHDLRPKWFTVPKSEWKTRAEATEACVEHCKEIALPHNTAKEPQA